MIVVSDTGPLNYLSLIGQIEILPSLYREVLIPIAVAVELSDSRAPVLIRDLIGAGPTWLRIQQALPADPELSKLGEGEQQAILLAQAVRADVLLCDDRDARNAARVRHIHVVGTIGVLQEAAEGGLLDLKDALAKLRATNFRISRSLIERLVAESTKTPPGE